MLRPLACIPLMQIKRTLADAPWWRSRSPYAAA